MNKPDLPDLPSYLPEMLEHLAQIVYRLLRAAGLDRELASRLALDVANTYAEEFGGSQQYVPFPETYMRSQRDLDIYHKARVEGRSMLALVQEYHLSESRIRRIIKFTAEREFNDRQEKLFS
ncbi:MAG: Mor transcription activator family protein [Burkholderia sp.]